MKVLKKAIYARYEESDLPASLTGGFHLQKARKTGGMVFPYGVYFEVIDLPTRTFTEKGESVTWQVNLFSKTSSDDEIESLFELLKAAFDDCTLSIEGYSHITTDRLSAIPLLVEDVYQYSITYRSVIQSSSSSSSFSSSSSSFSSSSSSFSSSSFSSSSFSSSSSSTSA